MAEHSRSRTREPSRPPGRHNATGTLWLYPSTGTGFGPRRKIGGGGWNSVRDLVGIGDFDRDGFTDLFAVQSATGKLFMYPGRGTSLGSPLQVATGWTTNYRPLL